MQEIEINGGLLEKSVHKLRVRADLHAQKIEKSVTLEFVTRGSVRARVELTSDNLAALKTALTTAMADAAKIRGDV